MRTTIRLVVAVALAVLLPAAIALAKPGDGGGSNKRGGGSKSSRSSSGRSNSSKSNNNFKRNNDAPQRSTNQVQKKSNNPVKKYQQQGGSPNKDFGKAGDYRRDKDSSKRYQGSKDFGKSGDAPQRLYRGNDYRARGDRAGQNAAFMKDNFPSQYKNFLKDSKGGYKKDLSPHYRVNHEGLQKLNRDNSFVKKYDIGGKAFDNHWTHHNNQWNRNWQGNNWNNNWGNRNFAWYPWSGWGGWNRWGYGFIWPAWNVRYYASPYYGYNYYYAGAAPVYTTNYQAAAAAPPADETTAPQAGANPTLAGAEQQNEVTEQDAASAAAFADQGELDFKAGNYHAAVKDWQHSLVDDPNNGAVMMLLGQALFAEGKYEEAAGATQAAMQMLPEDKWGVVVSNYAQLYGNVQDYSDQLRALEEARTANPDSPALRFVLGFQFGYLNYPKQAVRELDKALTLAPRDLGSRKVRELFAAQWPEAPPLPAVVLEAEAEAAQGDAPAAPPAEPAALPAPADAKPEDKIGSTP